MLQRGIYNCIYSPFKLNRDMINIIKKLLQQVLNNLDAGNSNLTEQEELEIINMLVKYTDKTKPLSKYQAYQYLNISRAKFDNLVAEGKLPKGKKVAGFKELFWFEKDLNKFINK